MKKTLAIILSLTLVITGCIILASCSKKESEDTTVINDAAENAVTGGWERADSPEITEDFKKVFTKATEKLDGVEYTPVAYIASQVVAGTNHRVLCKAEVVVPDAKPTYAILQIYEDLSGNAEVTEVFNSSADADYPEGLSGGRSEVILPVMSDEAKTALEKACETLTGAEYTPVALLSTQVVAGKNYRILCESKATVPNAETEYVIVTVYADLQGNTEITETFEFENEAGGESENAPADAESESATDN